MKLRWTMIYALAAASLVCGCSSPSGPSGPLDVPGGEPLTPDEIEYQRNLERNRMAAGGPLGEQGRAEMIVKLDASLAHWNVASIEQAGSDDRKLVDNLEEVLQREVYLKFDDVMFVLESGEPNQQAIAAAALGFSRLKVPEDPEQLRIFRDKWPPKYPRAVPVLTGKLRADDQLLVQNALLGLWKIGDPDTPLTPVIEKLSSDTTDIRANAALALSTILTPDSGEDAIAALINAMYDGSPKVRNHAINAAAATRHPNTAGRLAQLLADDNYLLIQANAARALGEIGDWRNAEYLIARLKTLLRDTPTGKFRERTDLDARRDLVARHVITSLQEISGKTYGDNVLKWEEWWAEQTGTEKA